MSDEEKEKRIMFLLKVWFFLIDNRLQWPAVKRWVEKKINEELPE